MDYTSHCMIMEEISRSSGSIGLSYGAHTALNIGKISYIIHKEFKSFKIN